MRYSQPNTGLPNKESEENPSKIPKTVTYKIDLMFMCRSCAPLPPLRIMIVLATRWETLLAIVNNLQTSSGFSGKSSKHCVVKAFAHNPSPRFFKTEEQILTTCIVLQILTRSLRICSENPLFNERRVYSLYATSAICSLFRIRNGNVNFCSFIIFLLCTYCSIQLIFMIIVTINRL